MKRIKLLPSVLMLVLCVGILAIGVYAASPITGTIAGTINITAAQGVKIAVYEGQSTDAEDLIQSAFGSSEVGLNAGGATLDASSATSPEQVEAHYYTIVLSTNQETNYVVDTETIELFDGIAGAEKAEGAAVVTKLHKPYTDDEGNITKDANGNACFTKDKPYTIQMSVQCGKILTEAISVSYEIEMKIYTESEYQTAGKSGVNGVDYLYFGEYPQSQVEVFESPEAITGYTETAEIFNVAAGAKNVYTKDGEVNGSKYIWAIGRESDIAGRPDVTFIYKIEPIKWRILSRDLSTGKIKVMSKTILDCSAFQTNFEGNYATDLEGNILEDADGNKLYANNYNVSNLRYFFIDTFYNNAFEVSERTIILAELVDNATGNSYDCGSTTDKIFALSKLEVKNTAYGFANTDESSNTRVLSYSSFAYNTNFCEKNSSYRGEGWWLRSPAGGTGGYYVEFAASTGNLNGDGSHNEPMIENGCVPAMVIGL